MNKLTEAQKENIRIKLMQGAVNRASTLSLFFAISFSIYGLTSYEFLQRFDNSITLWANTWPRILFNGLPFLVFHFIFKKYKERTVAKLWLWTLGFPIVFVSACLIHVWPLVYAGQTDLYMYVHAANILVLVMAFSVVSPPSFFQIGIQLATFLFFIVPLSGIFIHLNDFSLLKFFLSDSAFAFFLGGVSSHMSLRLRTVLATEDVLNQRRIERFVGNLVSKSIFENDESLLQPRKVEAFIIALDVRGFTHVMKSQTPDQASRFKENYHRLVATVVGEFGGFIHKTNGDGHLVTLGVMDSQVDLSDLPGLDHEVEKAEFRHRQQLAEKAILIFDRIYEQFEELKDQMGIGENSSVCAAIDFGEIGLNILGDPNVRLEFDIDGLVVIRCARLEAYTKTLRQTQSQFSSFLVLSASAAQYVDQRPDLQIHSTQLRPIPDFPDEKNIVFKEYRTRLRRKKSVA